MTVLASTNKQPGKLPKGCQYLNEVSTNQTKTRKSIKAIIGTNFDTDFAVPPGVKFTSFKGMMLPENNGTYGVTINLKYADNSVSTAYRKDVLMKSGQTYSLAFQSPTERQPYQINLNINGDNNNVYTISVMACR
jgi:hypothetical protein